MDLFMGPDLSKSRRPSSVASKSQRDTALGDNTVLRAEIPPLQLLECGAKLRLSDLNDVIQAGVTWAASRGASLHTSKGCWVVACAY